MCTDDLHRPRVAWQARSARVLAQRSLAYTPDHHFCHILPIHKRASCVNTVAVCDAIRVASQIAKIDFYRHRRHHIPLDAALPMCVKLHG
jgi:hypothetical protein